MKPIEIHPAFRLNGSSFSNEDLTEASYSFIKEGTNYEKAIGDFLLDWLSSTETITVQTSGSTGKPKKVTLKKENMVNSALATGDFFNLRPGNTALHCLPTEFIAGKMMLVRAMVLGLKIECIAPSSNPLKSNSKQFDFCAMVPLQLQNSIDQMDNIAQLIIGGAPLSNSRIKEVQGKRTSIYETYGMTETITHVALKKINNFDNKNQSVGSSFRALPNISFSKDERDCLIIDAPKIVTEKVKTNDIVNLISDKEFLWLGRHDNVINSGGIKLIPEQVENALAEIIGNRFFVTGLNDDALGDKLVLLVEGSKEIGLLERIKASKKLSKYELPKEIYFLSRFVETGNGKINRLETVKILQV